MTNGSALEYWAGLLAVILAVASLGVYAAGKVRTADDFALAGRSSGVLMVMGTIVGTAVGASSTVGTAQLAFKAGISAWWFCLGCCVGFVIMGFLYVKPLYFSRQTTVSQFLGLAYNQGAGIMASVFSALGIFFSAAASSLVLIPMLASCFSVSMEGGLAITFILIVLYVAFGGAWATGLVGVFKAGLLYIVLGVCFFAALKKVGGLSPILTEFPSVPWFTLFPDGFFTNLAAGASTVIGVMSTQTYIQGMCSAKNERAARLGMLFSGLFTLISALPAIWIGFFMRRLHPDIAPIDALPLFIMTYLPEWFAGVSVGMLIIAAVGSAAGLILGMSTIVSSDIISRLLPQFWQKNKLLSNRAALFAITFGTLLFTYRNNGALVLDWTILSMCLRGAGVFIPLCAALFWPGLFSPRYAAAAIAGGSLSALLWRILFPSTLSPLYPGMLVSAVFMAIGYWKRQDAGSAG
ncbi:MAG: sodium:solute symporter family protein [Acidaminococcales bacterium]|jgi:SSS family solute:Na+ symporter|nr:sodium:solute symporter family protein [Acidaminococcales bacterium]